MRHALLIAGLIAVTTSVAGAENFEVSGVKRSYAAIVPAKTPAPLVLVLHGNTQQRDDMQAASSGALGSAPIKLDL